MSIGDDEALSADLAAGRPRADRYRGSHLLALPVNTRYHPKADSFLRPIEPVLFLQEGRVPFDQTFDLPEGEFLFLSNGNLPAALISTTVRPDAHIAKRWDRVWFLTHETVSAMIWFALGWLLDSGILRLRKLAITYLAVRFFFVMFLVHPVAEFGWRLEVVCWMALGAYCLVAALRWVFSKLFSQRAGLDP